MNDGNLDELLRSYAERPIPTLPGNLEDTVWREIRLRRQRPVLESFLDWLAACIWRAHFAAPSLAAAVALGVGFAWLGQNVNAAGPISRALNLQVFAEHSPTLPLTRAYQEP